MTSATASPQAYRQGAVLAASRGQLVVMLYDGARRFLRQAAVAMREGQVELGHNKLRRAEMIIAHLDSTLDFEQGQISERLHSIYAFCLGHLGSARHTQDASKLDQVSDLLGELREAWAQVAAEPAAA
jgi:flagellar secretion chaperone FliS